METNREVVYAHNAGKPSIPIPQVTRSIVQPLVTWLIVLGEERKMTETQFKAEFKYQYIIAFIKSLFEKGLITHEELLRIEKASRERNRPIITELNLYNA